MEKLLEAGGSGAGEGNLGGLPVVRPGDASNALFNALFRYYALFNALLNADSRFESIVMHSLMRYCVATMHI